MSTIGPKAIRAHMAFLADDALEGRGVGSRGYDIAAKYVASQFEAMGLRPAGVGGSYMQPVPLDKFEVLPGKTSASVTSNGKPHALKFAQDFVAGRYPPRVDSALSDSVLDAPAVFVGFGVTAPELGYDDYAGVDVHGKVAVTFLLAAPATLPSEQRAYYSDWEVKLANAAAHGAVGLVYIMSPAIPFSWAWLMPQARAPGVDWVDETGIPAGTLSQVRGTAILNRSGAEALFAGAPQTLGHVFTVAAAGKPNSFSLGAAIRLHTVCRHTRIASPNVVAMLPGSDPQLRSEYVLYTAHLDHLGVGDPVAGDAIYNGALDNASGVAAMLTVAQAFAELSPAPKRSVLFAAMTAEEPWLIGSDYFAHNPTVPRGSLVANMNIDGTPGIFYPNADIVPLGAEHSTLSSVVADAARRLGFAISPDPAPEEGFFVRGDQFSFVKMGIPAVWVNDGPNTSDPKVDVKSIMQAWGGRYHEPNDDMKQKFDFASAARNAQLNLMIGYMVAQTPERPDWNKGDFFGDKFASKTPGAP